jgi:hypothetical protein
MARRLCVGVGLAATIAIAVPLSPQAPSSRSADVVTIVVSPKGDDGAEGTAEHPVRTLERAQQKVRAVNAEHDVVVQLDDGVYRVEKPLLFRAADGGQNERHVTWIAAPGAHPVISGGMAVAGWRMWDPARQIYVADVPEGVDARQLWVNDRLAPMASIELQRKDWNFTRQGMELRAGAENPLSAVREAKRLEMRATGFFTERISPVERVDGRALVMRQPAWDNNLWGYDTVEKPFHPELSHLYLVNALELLSQPGQWYLDPTKGKLYLRPPQGTEIGVLDVELPRLAVLVSISGTLDAPVRDLAFRGIRFSCTSWLGPSSDEGYASQQSGSFLAGRATAYPAYPIATCAQGCTAFESVRNEWHQMPAAVQVSAAERITFEDDVFAHLGQYALGIGNDDDATLSGVGLGTGDIRVVANVFTDLAGGAILAGGVQRDAHHPHDPRQTNQALIIRSNRIQSVSEDYRDNSAILSTYDAGAAILHNDISDVPYDAIDIGYGWGMQDPGGNPNYRFRMHGYDWKQNLIYETPTTHRDVVVANNRIHGAKRLFHDGGAIYNLSASPGTLITENYIFDNNAQIGIYLDEGSRYITVRRNVVQDVNGEWLNINTVHAAYPMRISPDNTALDNWHDGTKVGGMWTNYQNDLILNDHVVKDESWPSEAQEIMRSAGIEPSFGPVTYGDTQPSGDQRPSTPTHLAK